MKKYIIMFKGGVETQEFFSLEMARTFEENGYDIFWFDLVISAQSAHILRQFHEAQDGAVFMAFTFNFNGIAGEDGLYDDGYRSGSFWDDADIHVYNMVVDHPLYYHKYMHLRPKKYTQLSIDRNHIRYMQRFFPTVDLGGASGFVPLAGTELNAGGCILSECRYLPVKKRPMDVIFTGNYTPEQQFDKYLAHMDPAYRAFYHELLRAVKDKPELLIETSAEQKLVALAGETQEPLTDETLRSCMPNMMYVDLCVRFYYRAKVIAALADSGVKVHLFGAGWGLLPCGHPENLISAGSVNSRKCLDMISQAKLSINVMPWFKDGAHDRVFNSMLNGAVCISDKSKYLEEQFEDERDLLFYELNAFEGLGERVRELLEHPGRMQEISDRSYEKCVINHTWKNRAEQILRLMNRAE